MTTQSNSSLNPSWAQAICALIALIGLFYFATRLLAPSSQPNNIVDDGRLTAHVSRVAAEPHPMGSQANAKVRNYIVDYLDGLGLTTEIQRDTVVYKHPTRDRSGTRIANVENIVAVLKGSAPPDSIKTIALMTHYDSVPGAPGAGDAAAGVAGVLEAAYQLTRAPQPRNNVMFLITDGEEMGLFGAQAFFNQHPSAKEVDLVINFEARGSSGPSLMFETSKGNEWLIQQAAAAVPGLMANSLSYEIYQRMPNDTDVTISKAAGHQALNFAFIDDPFDYHASVDSPANIDRNTLRQHATNAVASARHFAEVDQWLPPQSDATYFNLLPDLLIQYGIGWEIALSIAVLALCLIAILRIRTEAQLKWRSVAYGLIAIVLFVVLISNVFETWIDYFRLSPGSWPKLAALGAEPFAAYATITVGIGIWLLTRLGSGTGSLIALLPFALVMLACIPAQRLNPMLFAVLIPAMLGLWWLRRRVTRESLVVAALFVWLLISVLLIWQVPRGAYVVVWPLGSVALSLSIATLIPQDKGYGRLAVLIIGSVIPLLILAPTVYLFYLSLGIGMPQLPMMVMALLVVLLLPLIFTAGSPMKGATGLALIGIGAALLWVSTSKDWPTDRHPAAESLFLAVDAERGQAYWASSENDPSEWVKSVLGPDRNRIELSQVIPNSKDSFWAGPGDTFAARALEVTVTGDRTVGDRRTLTFTLKSPQHAEYLSLFFPADLTFHRATANGREIVLPTDTDAEWRWQWYGLPAAGGKVELVVAANQSFDITSVEVAYTMPKPPVARPGTSRTHPYRWSDATVTYQTVSVAATAPAEKEIQDNVE